MSSATARVLDIAAFAIVVYALGNPLIRSLVDPRGFAIASDTAYRRQGVLADMRLAGIEFWVLAPALFVGGLHAALSFLWYSLFALLIFAGTFATAVPWLSQRLGLLRPEDPPPADDARLEHRIKAYRVIQLVQFTVLALWVYAWRHAVA